MGGPGGGVGNELMPPFGNGMGGAGFQQGSNNSALGIGGTQGGPGGASGFWPPAMGGGLDQQGQMYMPNQQQGGLLGGNSAGASGDGSGRRMVYNPATGQYTSMPAQGGGGGSSGGQGGGLGNNSRLGSGGMYGQQMQQQNGGIPSLLPRNQLHMLSSLDNGILGGGGGNDNAMGLNLFHGGAGGGMNNGRDDEQRLLAMGLGMNDYSRNNNNNNMLFGNKDLMNSRSNYNHHRDDMLDGYMRDRGGRDNGRDGYNTRDPRDGRRDGRDRDRMGGRNHNGAAGGSSGLNPVRDSLVEEFRSTYGKSRQWTLRDLLGHVVAFCQDQHGSRFIQQRLEVCSDVDKQLIYDEIMPAAQSLMTDVFGNYVLQKLFEYGSPEQCEGLAILLKGQAVQLAMQMYGCRVVQKALEYVSTPRLIELVAEFENPAVC